MNEPARSSAASRLVEFFALAKAARADEGLDRRALSAALEAVRRALDEAAERWADSDAEPALEALARAEERYRSDIAGLFSDTTALATVTGYAPPAPDARKTVSTYDERLARIDRATRSLAPVAGGPLVRWTARAARWSLLALALAFVGRSVIARFHKPAMSASASASWGEIAAFGHVADGDIETNWVLPDHTPGWARVAFASRRVRQVRLFSVRRLPSYGAQQCTIEVERGGQIVHSARVDLLSIVGKRAPFVYRLPSATEADAVRVHVHTWHGLGGGLSEIEID
jgi:hypothetical protein